MRRARTPDNEPGKVAYHTFGVIWKENNNADNWIKHLKTQVAYNDKCRCTQTGGKRVERMKYVYIRIPITERDVFRAFVELKTSELNLWDIDSANEIKSQDVPMHDNETCFYFN